MADARLRDLERRFHETPIFEHEVALLRHRLRCGMLERRALRVAAWTGHPAARALLKAPAAFDPRWPHEVAVRTAIALAQAMWVRQPRRIARQEARHEEMVLAAERWVVCPCEEHRAAAARALARRFERAGELQRAEHTSDYFGSPFLPLAEAATALVTGPPSRLDRALSWLGLVALVHEPSSSILERALDGARSHLGRESVEAALCAELVPWALGHGDPVAHRVSARTPARSTVV